MSKPKRSGYIQTPTSPSTQDLSRNAPTTPGRSSRSPRAVTFAQAGQRQPQPSFVRKLSASGRSGEESRYLLSPSARGVQSISEKYHLAADPASWGYDITHAEPDDGLHDPRSDDRSSFSIFNMRSISNVGCMLILSVLILALFVAYPVVSHFQNTPVSARLLHLNATGQVPNIGNFGLIDRDTPEEMYTINGYRDPSNPAEKYQLVFSDEFETEGRSFYAGDDPYWEAVDLHYWATGNLEWYDPSALTTRNGALEINLTRVDDPSQNHNMQYRGGMMATWNKFCFTGGIILANVMLPGATNVHGLWPAVWTMGNLGRAGYGATLDGLWPYAYDACDVGTLANQTLNGGPPAALTSGHDDYNGELSYLPGQRLSRCTCPGESHPGPMHEDGTYVGRSSPEIDVIEAQIGELNGVEVGQVSMSAQWAPFDESYTWKNTSDNMVIADLTTSHLNSYAGGVYQQATSVVATTNQSCYQLTEQCFSVQGFEYVPGYNDAYITWITNNEVTWTLRADGVGANTGTQISARPISEEPMYILVNLGISPAFGFVDVEHLVFPAIMRIEWIRVYQRADRINIGCDPPERPTAAYIEAYKDAYTNPNYTTWEDDYKQPFPKNKLVDQC